MSKKHWYTVMIVQEKTVRIYAEDREDAKDKAYEKAGVLWSAEDAWREDGTAE
jgi:hypothetical protein